MEDEESDDEGTGENATEDREAIANTLFDMSDNVIIMKTIINEKTFYLFYIIYF